MVSIAHLNLAWRFARRELRGGLSGFFVLIACIALGVGAISGVNTVARSITHAISSEGQLILGGDVSFSVVQQDIPKEARAFLQNRGEITKITSMRAMARLEDGSDQSLIELKGVDQAYPLYGDLEGNRGKLETKTLGPDQAWVDRVLLDRLNLKLGDVILIGKKSFTLVNTIKSEPDRIGEGVGFGPKVIISSTAMMKTGLIQPGSMVRYTYHMKNPQADSIQLKQIIDKARTQFSEVGWRIRSRNNAAPALSQNIARFSQFLTLVGLTALIVGGVGVANAIRAFLERKRPVIATFKSLGAPTHLIFFTYLFQILTLASLGIMLGLCIGIAAPFAAAYALEGLVPISRDALIYPSALVLGAVFGLITAFTFAVWPLALSLETPVAALFRSSSFKAIKIPRVVYIFATGAGIIALASLAIYISENKIVAMIFIAAISFAFLFLQLVSLAIQWFARKFPKIGGTELRLAIANIHRPGALTPSVVLSLGLGLALLVTLAQIDGNMRRQISDNLPKQAPDFFFVDIQNSKINEFREQLRQVAGPSKIISVPMLRGRITHLKNISAQTYAAKGGQGTWVLRGDRGITYAQNIPENSTLAKGKWWPANYDGPPLVSFSAEEAEELGLDVGDEITVNVLGRNITATISSLRQVQWESLGINFVLVFSPNTFVGAPHSFLSTLKRLSTDKANEDGKILRHIAQNFPGVTSVAVGDVLITVNQLISQLATAIRAAASVALIASIFVLGGALAAGNQRRVHDAVILKTLGATRLKVIKTYVYEYVILGLTTGVFALVAGGVAAWYVIDQIMQFDSNFLIEVGITTLLIALLWTVAFGLIGTWRILGQKAAPVLREL